MFSNNNNNNNNNSSTKDEPLDLNGEPKTPSSNMAPPLNSMLQMTNSLQSANSPYNPSNKSRLEILLHGQSELWTHVQRTSTATDGTHESSSTTYAISGRKTLVDANRFDAERSSLSRKWILIIVCSVHLIRCLPISIRIIQDISLHRIPTTCIEWCHLITQWIRMEWWWGHPPGPPGRSSKGHPLQAPHGAGGPPSDPMQSHLHHLPHPHYVKMPNMDPSMMGPGHPPQHLRFPPMMDEGFGMGPRSSSSSFSSSSSSTHASASPDALKR